MKKTAHCQLKGSLDFSVLNMTFVAQFQFFFWSEFLSFLCGCFPVQYLAWCFGLEQSKQIRATSRCHPQSANLSCKAYTKWTIWAALSQLSCGITADADVCYGLTRWTIVPFICWGVWQGAGCASTTPQLVKRFLSFLKMAGQENSGLGRQNYHVRAHLLDHSWLHQEKKAFFSKGKLNFKCFFFFFQSQKVQDWVEIKNLKTSNEREWSTNVSGMRKTVMLQIAKNQTCLVELQEARAHQSAEHELQLVPPCDFPAAAPVLLPNLCN